MFPLCISLFMKHGVKKSDKLQTEDHRCKYSHSVQGTSFPGGAERPVFVNDKKTWRRWMDDGVWRDRQRLKIQRKKKEKFRSSTQLFSAQSEWGSYIMTLDSTSGWKTHTHTHTLAILQRTTKWAQLGPRPFLLTHHRTPIQEEV